MLKEKNYSIPRITRLLLAGFLMVLATIAVSMAAEKPKAPRAAVHCEVNDLGVRPTPFKEGTHIQMFLVKYTCQNGAMNDVDIEIWHEDLHGGKDQLAMAANVELKQGTNVIEMKRYAAFKGGGGKLVAVFKSVGQREFSRHVRELRCQGWGLQ